MKPSFLTWLLHWLSAFLTLFLLLTSLGSAFALLPRAFHSIWMGLHLSTAALLLIITAIRIAISAVHGQFAMSGGWVARRVALRNVLLVVVFLTAVVGLLLYQKPPLGKVSYLFSVVPMPNVVRLDHSWHNFAINIHIAMGCLLLILIIAHVAAGIKHKGMTGKPRLFEMIWPW